MSESLPSVYEFSEDLSTVEAPPPLPAREYRASVRAIEPSIGKESGKPNAKVSYYISADQYPADYTEGNPDGEVLLFWFSLDDNPKNRYRLRKLCEMHGVAPSNRLELTSFIGQDVIVSVTHEAYQGVQQARVNPVRAA